MTTAMYISEGLAALVATIFYYKYKHLPIRLIVIVLWAAVITEIGAYLYSHYVYPNNHWVYNLYSFSFYVLIFKMIYDHIHNPLRKKIVAILSTIVIAGIIIRALTTPSLTRYMTTTYNIALGVVVICLMYYAIDRLKSDAPLRPKHELELFVFAGYLLFGICFIPISWFRMGQIGLRYSQSFHDGIQAIQGLILISMNLLLVFGFIWTQPIKEAKELL